MKFKLFSTLTILMATLFVHAQTNVLRVNANIKLPQDSIQSKNLISSLNDFLVSAEKPNAENKLVLETEKVETFILLDEINSIQKSGKFKDEFFYKPYLTNVVLVKENQYLLQISYIGVNENTPLLRASFELIAHKTNNSFSFSSPLVRNTTNWRTEKIGNNVFHYQTTLNKPKTAEFNKLALSFDKKLSLVNKTTEFYCCENFSELLKLIGIDYKSDYNGESQNVFTSSFGDKQIFVLGNNNSSFNHFDSHDLWHDRLSLKISRDLVNNPVDEGCAYFYGGSWGMTWNEIFKEFKSQVASNKSTNWVEIKDKPVYFKTMGIDNSADYIINSLLVQKIEKEKGFEGVWELLNCGQYEQGNDKYYKTLEKLTGITKANYNDKIWELVNNENKTTSKL